MDPVILSWGRAHRMPHRVFRPRYRDMLEPAVAARNAPNGHVLPHGMGRSYGDSNLNEDGALILTRDLDRILAADWNKGIVRAEAGSTLDDLIRVSVPRGWFPAVVPGTKFVTLGGAVANDVHGKNHHVTGSFGSSVRALGLLRSDGTRQDLSPERNAELFTLTIGGLGLTGLIEWVEIQMSPITSSEIEIEVQRVEHLDAFFELCQDCAPWPFAVAWVDCFAPKSALGRGLISRGRFAPTGPLEVHGDRVVAWPIKSPSLALNRYSITAFNRAYWTLSKTGAGLRKSYDRFFFPLDRIGHWNRLYGRRGLFQHHSLLPPDEARPGFRKLLTQIRDSGQGSFLAVMKNHGPERSPGRLSFGGEGFSLALDFANRGRSTLELLDRLDAVVRAHGGRVYPAKDGRMAGDFFRTSYPGWRELEAARDPAFSSSFWRRVTQDA